MAQTVRCSCGANYVYQPELLGRTITCRRCVAQFVLTEPTESSADRLYSRQSDSELTFQRVNEMVPSPAELSGFRTSTTPWPAATKPAYDTPPAPPPVRFVQPAEDLGEEDLVDPDEAADAAKRRRKSVRSTAMDPGGGGFAANNRVLVCLAGVAAMSLAMCAIPATRDVGLLALLIVAVAATIGGLIWWLYQTLIAYRPVPLWFGMLCVLMPAVIVFAALFAVVRHWSTVRSGFLTFVLGGALLCTALVIGNSVHPVDAHRSAGQRLGSTFAPSSTR